MTFHDVVTIVHQECRRRGVPIDPRSPLDFAIRDAAMRIAAEADANQRAAAKTASMVGASITHGRVRL